MSEFNPQPKFFYYRSKEHLKNVRSLPCAGCSTTYGVQAAHSNSASFGKGRGIKASDESCIPLCGQLCHPRHDQPFDKVQRDENHDKWLKKTANLLKHLGKLLPDAERLLIERGVLNDI